MTNERESEITRMAEEMVRMAHDDLQNAEWESPWWDDIEGRARCVYVGSVLFLTPSGKYYVPWSTNVTEEEALEDELFWEAAENAASELGCWIESGDGDPLDVFLAEMEEE